jgi:hypothetical protein
MDLCCHVNVGGHSPTLDPKSGCALLIEQQSLDKQEVRARVVQAAQTRNADEGRPRGRKNRNLRGLE